MTGGRPTHKGWNVNYIRHGEQAKGEKRELRILVIT